MMRLEGIELRYEGKTALQLESLDIAAGEFIALVGPNGSGKTSLLKLLAAQIKPNVGCIRLEGRDLNAFSPKERSRKLAYFPQDRPLPNMDVQTLVSHGRFPHQGFGRIMQEADQRAVQEALQLAGLEAFAQRTLHSLSGGERQRAYLAMLIAQDADVLLLDEPSTFLDIRYQLEVLEILRQLHQCGKTILCAIHDLPAAFSYAARILLLQEGHLVADAAPAALAQSHKLEEVFTVRLQEQNEAALFRYGIAAPKKIADT